MAVGIAAGAAPGWRVLMTVVGITLGTALTALGTAGAGFGGDMMTCRGRDANSLTTSTRNQYNQIKFCESFTYWLVGTKAATNENRFSMVRGTFPVISLSVLSVGMAALIQLLLY